MEQDSPCPQHGQTDHPDASSSSCWECKKTCPCIRCLPVKLSALDGGQGRSGWLQWLDADKFLCHYVTSGLKSPILAPGVKDLSDWVHSQSGAPKDNARPKLFQPFPTLATANEEEERVRYQNGSSPRNLDPFIQNLSDMRVDDNICKRLVSRRAATHKWKSLQCLCLCGEYRLLL